MNKKEWKQRIGQIREVRRHVLRFIKRRYDKEAREALVKEGADLIKSEILGDVKVKEDRLAHQTLLYCLNEKEFDELKAKWVVLVDQEFVVMLPTDALRFLIFSCDIKKKIPIGYKLTNGRKQDGWLIPRDYILSSPYVDITKRWFPSFI